MVNKFAENFAQQGQGNSLRGMLSRMKKMKKAENSTSELMEFYGGGGLHTENEVVDTSDLCCGDCAVLEWCKCS